MASRFLASFLSIVVLLAASLACSLPGSSPSSNTPVPVVEVPSGGVPSNTGGSGACDNPLYPVVIGASWTYKFNGGVPGDFTRSITAVNDDGFFDQDVFTSGITRTGEWKCNAGALIALDPNGGSTAAVQSSTIDSTFETIAMDGVTLPANVNAGESWTQNFTIEGTETIKGVAVASKNQTAYSCTAGGSESVTVAAGTFNAVRMECQTNITITITMNGAEIPTNVTTTSTIWYAPGVGMVKSDNVVSGTGNNTIELTAYNIP
jgi:hypothetical protein